MQHFTFHVVSLPNTQTTKEYNACAYTEKVRKFCNMMKSLGHTVYLYAGEENEANCDELITIITNKEQRKWFGVQDKNKLFNIEHNRDDVYWTVPNGRAIVEIKKRLHDNSDFICLIAGRCHQQIAEAFEDNTSVEFGIGYRGVFSQYKVFESYAWMNYHYGIREARGSFCDCVIPNYFETESFPIAHPLEIKDYLLYVGRVVESKGLDIAVDISNATGKELIIAGQGVTRCFEDEEHNKHIIAGRMHLIGANIRAIGHINTEQRGKLMSEALAVIVPTRYVEPFGGVNVEAQLCGTPVISTDWGVFAETVIDHVTG